MPSKRSRSQQVSPSSPVAAGKAQPVPALPAWKAFVVQLSHDTEPQGKTFAGRVEHLTSGRRLRFASGKELLSAVVRLLGEVEKDR